LTANEVSAAIGGRAGSSQEDNIVIPNGPAKGDIMGMCMWRAGAGGMVSVNMVHALQSAQREAGFAKLEENFAKLKAQGWTQETKVIGDAKCLSMKPPTGRDNVPGMTGCMVEAKGMALSVGAMSSGNQVAMEPIKELLDKAVARLQ